MNSDGSTAVEPRISPGGNTSDHSDISFSNVVRSEWVKLRTLRSTGWLIMSMPVLVVGISVSVCLTRGVNSTTEAVSTTQIGFLLGQYPLILIGAIAGGSEFSTGMIHVSAIAVPRRTRLLMGKIAAAISTAGLATLLVAVTVYFVGESLLDFDASEQISPGLVASVLAQQTVSSGSLVTIGVCLGFIMRSTVGAISGAILLSVLLPVVGAAIQSTPGGGLLGYLPITRSGEYGFGMLGPTGWDGVAVGIAWSAGSLMCAWVFFKRRDIG